MMRCKSLKNICLRLNLSRLNSSVPLVCRVIKKVAMIKKNIRHIVFHKYGGHCAYCGGLINTKEMQIDHIIPKAFFLWHIKNKYKIPLFLLHLTEADVNHIDNLMPTCR